MCSNISEIPQVDGNVSFLNSTVCSVIHEKIPVIITNRISKQKPQKRISSNKVIRRSNRLLAAVHLPVVVNLNPRSIYNKVEEFKIMMSQLDCSLCFLSESWDRNNLGLDEIIQIENYKIIKNVSQRKGKGGKPALIISEKNYHIKNICPDIITVLAKY